MTSSRLCEEYDVGVAGPLATNLQALKAHVEGMSAQGLKRIGVAAVDPATVKTPPTQRTSTRRWGRSAATVSRMIVHRRARRVKKTDPRT